MKKDIVLHQDLEEKGCSDHSSDSEGDRSRHHTTVIGGAKTEPTGLVKLGGDHREYHEEVEIRAGRPRDW